MSSFAIGLGVASLAVAAAGTGVSVYGTSQSAAASKAAGALNARQQKAQARATAAVQRFQAQLNYKVAMAQAQIYNNNAIVLRDQARSTERQGFEGIKRMLMQETQDQSSSRAGYGASGVQSDTGSPLVVEAYNAGMAQLARMDSAYKTNLEAGSMDWEARMQDYQAELTRETSKQYQYAEQMANWTEKTGIIAANATQMAGTQMATAQMVTGYGNAASNFSGALSGFANTYSNWRQPSSGTSNPAPVTSVTTQSAPAARG
jgi:hypothetical protein